MKLDFKHIPRRAVVRYTLLQIPELLILLVILIWLNYAAIISQSALWLIMSIWLLKDIVMFFFLWPAYDRHEHIAVKDIGIAIENIDPEGYVQVSGELWRARSENPEKVLKKGDRVRIKEIHNLTLVVAPAQEKS